MRAEATIKNSLWGLLQQFIICILSIFSRSVMINTIGIEGVGLNGLLTNVVAVLSLAEMGIGTAIIFHMFKPLAYHDEEKVSSLLNFYRRVYLIIAVTVFTVGLSIMPLMRYIVHDVSYSNSYVLRIFLLFLIQTSSSYLFTYKRSLLSADQKQYIISIFDLVMKIVTILGGIVILKMTKELSYYLIFLTLAGLINNIMISIRVDRMYPYIKRNKNLLERSERKSIFKDVKNIFIGRMSSTITNSTDNILISALVGTIVTGLYSNYTIILNTLTSIMNQFSYAMMGSMGNMVVTETSEHIEKVLKTLVFIMFFIASFCSVCLICLIDPFITLVFGDNLLLERYVVYICIGVFYFSSIKIPIWIMVQASGLFKVDKYIAIAGSTINLVVSFVLGKMIGIAGILLGTICTYVIQYNLKAVILYKKILHKNYMRIILITMFYFIIACAECLFTSFLVIKLPDINPYLRFIISGIIAASVPLIINCLLFRNRPEFIDFKNRCLSILGGKLHRRSA